MGSYCQLMHDYNRCHTCIYGAAIRDLYYMMTEPHNHIHYAPTYWGKPYTLRSYLLGL